MIHAAVVVRAVDEAAVVATAALMLRCGGGGGEIKRRRGRHACGGNWSGDNSNRSRSDKSSLYSYSRTTACKSIKWSRNLKLHRRKHHIHVLQHGALAGPMLRSSESNHSNLPNLKPRHACMHV